MNSIHLDTQDDCEMCKDSRRINSCADGTDSAHFGCYLLKRVEQMQNEHEELIEICQVLASESPLAAFETLHDTMFSIELDALFQDEITFAQIGDAVTQALENDGNSRTPGKLWASVRVVRNQIIGCSFLEWMGIKTKMEESNLSPYRLHLLVLRDSDYNGDQLLTLLDLIYNSNELYGGFYVPLIYKPKSPQKPTNEISLFTTKYQSHLTGNFFNLKSAINLCIILREGKCLIGKQTLPLFVYKRTIYFSAIKLLLDSINFKNSSKELQSVIIK